MKLRLRDGSKEIVQHVMVLVISTTMKAQNAGHVMALEKRNITQRRIKMDKFEQAIVDNTAQLEADGITYTVKPSISREKEVSIYLTNGRRIVYVLSTGRAKYRNKSYTPITLKGFLKRNNLEVAK